MDKGYYIKVSYSASLLAICVAIHNKNGQGLLRIIIKIKCFYLVVAIHNKNGQGLLLKIAFTTRGGNTVAIHNKNGQGLLPQYHLMVNLYTKSRNPQ